MSDEDQEYISKYTSSYYQQMNKYLRDGSNSNDMEVVDYVNGLKRVLSKNTAPLSQDTKLFRTFKKRSLRHTFDKDILDAIDVAANSLGKDDVAVAKMKDLVVGGTLDDKGFVSSSYMKDAFGGSSSDVLVEIYAPKGYKNGMFIESTSEFSFEKEYLFNAGMTFDIVDILVDGGKIILRVTPKN